MENNSVDKATVLYVDDIKANLMLFEASFDGDYNILLAESGNEALTILMESDVHVIVSDQNMPGMTGNELLEKVTLEYPDVMRFMITAYTDYETVVEAINKGHLYGFFNKPYNIEDVKLSINKSLEVRQLRIHNREMIEKLGKANEALLGIDKSKTNFLTSVTDEIRTPINKIMTAVHMIKDKIDSKELTELLNLLDVSVSRLENFSEIAKQLARLNDPAIALKSEQLSLKELVEVCIIEKGNVLKTKNIAFSMDTEESEDMIQGEFDLVLICFSSLLEWLAEHSEEGAEFFCGVKKVDERVSLKLSTSKAGVSENSAAYFNSFLNGTDSPIKDYRIEFILAKEIVEAHKGSISFVADSNDNATFELSFPVIS